MIKSIAVDEKKCLGCTTCIKMCPTEAIRVHGRKAIINYDLCVCCGQCMSSCPHNAIRSISDKLDDMNKFKYKVALPDPSLYGQFNNIDDIDLILNALLEIGFDDVYEPAAAAEMISYYASVPLLKKSQYNEDGPLISSCCPTILKLIKIRFPKLIPNVVSTVTPMELAAAIARRTAIKKTGLSSEEIGIIAIVPCSSQVTDVHAPETMFNQVIDYAVPIRDVYQKLLPALKNLDINNLKPLCRTGKSGISHSYVGGESRARLAKSYLAVDGIQNCINMLNDIEDGNIPSTDYVELNACVQGCVGGCLNVENPYSARLKIKNLGKRMPLFRDSNKLLGNELNMIYAYKELEYVPVMLLDKDRMVAIEKMSRINEFRKHLPGLDCGSCGAPSCNAFASDVIQGKASEQDCIFQVQKRMRKLAGSDNIDDILPAFIRHSHEED